MALHTSVFLSLETKRDCRYAVTGSSLSDLPASLAIPAQPGRSQVERSRAAESRQGTSPSVISQRRPIGTSIDHHQTSARDLYQVCGPPPHAPRPRADLTLFGNHRAVTQQPCRPFAWQRSTLSSSRMRSTISSTSSGELSETDHPHEMPKLSAATLNPYTASVRVACFQKDRRRRERRGGQVRRHLGSSVVRRSHIR